MTNASLPHTTAIRALLILAVAVCVALVLVFAPVLALAQNASAQHSYGGVDGRQFSPLRQIRPDNLDQLELAWRFQTGDLGQGFARKRHSMQAQPVYWNGLLFISTSSNWVIAVDAATGAERWRFDAELPKDISYAESASRGVSLWHGDSEVCPDRVFLGTLLGQVFALNALTGEPCTDFGNNGQVDLTIDVGEVSPGEYGITSPPAVLGDQLIVGSAIGDNRAARLERGIVRSLDVRTGAIHWSWDPIPASSDDPAYASWADGSALVTGAANVWPPITVDTGNNLVFLSTGSPSPDFYGGERLGDNHYANSLVALDGSSGQVRWWQQLVHHDVWDYDIPSQPTLTTIQYNGQQHQAVAVVTKTGMLYAFDRLRGEPVYAVEEKPVPASAVPGEQLSPTQPFSSFPALANQSPVSRDDLFGLTFLDKRSCVRIQRSARNEGIFTPPSFQGSIMNPSYAGGSNWGGMAVDSERQIAVANINQIPALVHLIPRDGLQAFYEEHGEDDWEVAEQRGTPYYMARKIFLSSLGLPCTKPPWNKLVAMDLANASILWEVPLGTVRDLAPGLVPNFNWGAPGMGGPLITASGLIVIGAVTEHVLRIFDLNNGEELWTYDLPTAAMALPMSYEHEGEQYIAIVAGGHDNLDMPRGDYLYAFKLLSLNTP
ncbi:MAG: pyrroloquinoline quinone-dependent dehydrogenase [Pseudomonadales bacterium]|nr:pyrroloquinoline quinone-dependent dehydrogenase [Pseudomonadales bacterium]